MKEIFMQRAIELARKGQGFTAPNPCVGAVVVKGEHIVAEGCHIKAGEDHAEVVAIKKMMKKSGIVSVDLDPALFQNATLYVTLEPCAHSGKTPSCARAVAAAGFKKVCIGMKDPFKKVNGRGIKILKEANIEVEICRPNSSVVREIRNLNQGFIKWAEHGLPYVLMKAGISLDGRIATSGGESKWITCAVARDDARMERSLCDAVLVGAGTVIADDPELASCGKFKLKKLLRVVIDPGLKVPLGRKVFRDENVLVFCDADIGEKKLAKFKNAGVEVKKMSRGGNVLLSNLKYLAKRGVQSVFVEGGAGVHGLLYDSFLKNRKILDKVIFYVAPRLIGGKSALSVVGGEGVEKLAKSEVLSDVSIKKVGSDLKVEGVYNFY